MEVISVQNVMKLMSLHLETQTDARIRVSDCCSQHDRRGHVESQTGGNVTIRTDRVQVNFCKWTVLQTLTLLVIIVWFIIIHSGPPASESSCNIHQHGWKFLKQSTKSDYSQNFSFILWHVEPLLGNDREISDYTTTIARDSSGNHRLENVRCWKPLRSNS
jgi:hypothetical protein